MPYQTTEPQNQIRSVTKFQSNKHDNQHIVFEVLRHPEKPHFELRTQRCITVHCAEMLELTMTHFKFQARRQSSAPRLEQEKVVGLLVEGSRTWRSPTGIFVENLVGPPEVLASSVTTGGASSPTEALTLAPAALLRAPPQREVEALAATRRGRGSGSRAAGTPPTAWWKARCVCGGGGRRRRWWSAPGVASISRRRRGGGGRGRREGGDASNEPYRFRFHGFVYVRFIVS